MLAGTPTGSIIGHEKTTLSRGFKVADLVSFIAFTAVIFVGGIILQLAVLQPTLLIAGLKLDKHGFETVS